MFIFNSTQARPKLGGKLKISIFNINSFDYFFFFAIFLSTFIRGEFWKKYIQGYRYLIYCGYQLNQYFFYLPYFYSNSAQLHLIQQLMFYNKSSAQIRQIMILYKCYLYGCSYNIKMDEVTRLYNQKNYGLALEKAKQANNEEGMEFMLAKIYWAMEEPDMAENYFIYAIDNNPNNEQYRLTMGQFYFHQEMYSQSRKVFQNLLKTRKNDFEVYTFLGKIYVIQGDFLQAQKHLMKSLELEPTQQESRRYLRKVQKQISKQKQISRTTIESLKKKVQQLQTQIQKQRNLGSSCVICYDNQASYASNTCGHCSICEQCLQKLVSNRCPICTRIGQYIKISKV